MMEIKYLNSAKWQAFMEQRKQDERLIAEKIARGELDPESIFSFGRELAKRPVTVRWDQDALRNLAL